MKQGDQSGNGQGAELIPANQPARQQAIGRNIEGKEPGCCPSNKGMHLAVSVQADEDPVKAPQAEQHQGGRGGLGPPALRTLPEVDQQRQDQQ